MDSNTQPLVQINLKDLLFVMLKKTGVILLAGIIVAAAVFCYKYFSGAKDANTLDISERLDGETDAQYSERILYVNRAEDIINSISALNNQIDNQREYIANSVLMQIDAENEAVTTAQLVVTVDDSTTNGIDNVLVSSYSQDILTGGYLVELAEELGTNQGYLAELVKVEYKASTSAVVNAEESAGSAGTVTITVVGPTMDYTERIMEQILAEVEYKHTEYNETIIPHTIVSAGTQSLYKVDINTRDSQYNAINRLETIQRQIDSNDKILDELATKLDLNSKSIIYEYFSVNNSANESSSFGASLKFAAIGFAVGVFFVLAVLALKYVFGKRFSTQAKFYSRFVQVAKIGVAKPSRNRSRISKFIDKKTGDDTNLSEENNNKLLAANIKNLTLGFNKVLFTGTAETSKMEALIKNLGVKADVKSSFFDDPSSLESISDYDAVIIIEQRDYSDCKLIAEELKLISNTNTKLIGAIVI